MLLTRNTEVIPEATNYQKLIALRKGFVPQVEIFWDNDGSILTDRREVIERWKQHYDEHLFPTIVRWSEYGLHKNLRVKKDSPGDGGLQP